MDNRLKLPVGIEDFEEIRKEGFYYIDKTKLIEQLLMQLGKGKPLYASAAFWQDFEYEYV